MIAGIACFDAKVEDPLAFRRVGVAGIAHVGRTLTAVTAADHGEGAPKDNCKAALTECIANNPEINWDDCVGGVLLIFCNVEE